MVDPDPECDTCGGSGWVNEFPPGGNVPITAECPDCSWDGRE